MQLTYILKRFKISAQMKSIIYLLLIWGCAHQSQKPELSTESKNDPAWIYSPYDECIEANEICATGEARTMSEADAQARSNLASIFEVKVSTELNSFSASSQSFPWQAQVNQQVQQSLSESVSQILEVVEIKNHFRKDGLTYSLASLDKAKASLLIESRMKKLDQQIEVLWAHRQRTNFRRIVRLSQEREKLNERYSIISGTSKPAVVSFEQIYKWKETRSAQLPITIKVGQAPDWLVEKLKELLTEAGFRIVKGGTPRVLAVNVESIKEFLNVDGFEKYTFTLNMSNVEEGDKKKVISTSETVTGRTQADALLKVKQFFTEYIEQHLSDLHLD